jgi:predicted HNH restriction endonuclease
MPFKDEAVRKAKQKVYARKWYEGNRQKVIKRARKDRDKNRVEWIAYKSKQRCSHCRKKHPAIIDFHHVIKEGKRSVNYLAVRKRNIAEAIKEAEEKCIPLCSNCHRILHWDLTRKAMRVRRKKRGDSPDIS